MCLRWKDEKLRVTYDSAVVLKSVLQRQKVRTKERVIRTCKTHTFTQFRMHDIHDKQNCEGTSISKNVQNKRIQHFFKKKNGENSIMDSYSASRNVKGWGRKTGKRERV